MTKIPDETLVELRLHAEDVDGSNPELDRKISRAVSANSQTYAPYQPFTADPRSAHWLTKELAPEARMVAEELPGGAWKVVLHHRGTLEQAKGPSLALAILRCTFTVLTTLDEFPPHLRARAERRTPPFDLTWVKRLRAQLEEGTLGWTKLNEELIKFGQAYVPRLSELSYVSNTDFAYEYVSLIQPGLVPALHPYAKAQPGELLVRAWTASYPNCACSGKTRPLALLIGLFTELDQLLTRNGGTTGGRDQ